MSNAERQLLETIVPQLTAEGYQVYINPPAEMVPPFVHGYSPDAIALGLHNNLIIEIVSERPSQVRLEDIQKRLKDAPDWELRVYYTRPEDEGTSPTIASELEIEHAIGDIQNLLQSGALRSALLLSWGVFEALARALFPKKFGRPQTPGRLVEVLATSGDLTPSEADFIRPLVTARNRLIHGGLNVVVGKTDLEAFLVVLKNLLDQLRKSRKPKK